jgi:thioredoxin reductase
MRSQCVSQSFSRKSRFSTEADHVELRDLALVAESKEQVFLGGRKFKMASSNPLRIAVIGAGPIGIEAALYAKSLGFAATIYERGDVGEHMSRWGHVRLFSPFSLNHTPLGLELIRKELPQHQLPAPNDLLTGLEHRDAYLLPLSLTSTLCESIRVKTTVLHIGRGNVLKSVPAADPKRTFSPFRLLTRDDNRRERIDEADVVLDCSGTFGRHRYLGQGGIPALGELSAEQHIAYGLEDILGKRKAHYAGKSTIVIGGGYSAATAVCSLASLSEQNQSSWIIWLMRGPRTTPLPRYSADPLRERDRLAARANSLATRGEGHVEHHSQTVIDTIESHGPDRGFRVVGRRVGEELNWEVERVIANVGYLPDLSLCSELHVVEPGGKYGVRQPEPNYFMLGAKSFGRESSFLIRQGFDQVREVFALITGRPRLDLYSSKTVAFPVYAG